MLSKTIIVLANPVMAIDVAVYNSDDLTIPIWDTKVWMPDLIPCIKSVYTEEMDSIKLVGVREFVKHIRDNLEMELPQANIEIVDVNKLQEQMENVND